MKQQSQKIVFFGNERLATGISTTAPTLRKLIDAGYEAAAVIVKNEPARSRKLRTLEIAKIANEYDIPVLAPQSLTEIKDQLAALGANIGVLVAYGKIVPTSIIELFPHGIVNIHPSLLPRHRGPTPIESVILSGENQTGVSLMKLVKEMDAGPVYKQRVLSVPERIQKQDLADSLLQLGSDMLIECLPSILKNVLKPIPQDDVLATYDSLIQKSNGVIDWNKPAERLEREIRAYSGWPKSLGKVGDHQVIIKNADVINTTGKAGNYQVIQKSLIVHCGHSSLKITRLQPLGKQEMPIEAFLAGYKL